MGIAMVIHIFDFSKTFSQIHFKLGWNMPWVPGKFVQMVIQWVSYIKKNEKKNFLFWGGLLYMSVDYHAYMEFIVYVIWEQFELAQWYCTC